MSKRLQHKDLDDASGPPAFFRREQQTLQEPGRVRKGAPLPIALAPRQEQPGQGDVLVLAQVGEVVIDGQVCSRAQRRDSSALPIQTRARSAGTGRTLGKKSLT